MLATAPLVALIDRMAAADSMTDLACLSGVDRRALQRIRARSRIRWDAADRIAVALGHHPSELWPEWFAQVQP
jgi:lambda repressor-like predicted transcriptional regulator